MSRNYIKNIDSLKEALEEPSKNAVLGRHGKTAPAGWPKTGHGAPHLGDHERLFDEIDSTALSHGSSVSLFRTDSSCGRAPQNPAARPARRANRRGEHPPGTRLLGRQPERSSAGR